MDKGNQDEYFNRRSVPPDDYDNIEGTGDLPNLDNLFTGLATSDNSTVTEDSNSKKTIEDVTVTVPVIVNYETVNSDPDDAKLNDSSSTEMQLRTTSPRPPSPKHKCFDVLQGRRKAVKKKADHIQIMSNIMKLRMKLFIPHSMMYNEKVLNWHCSTRAFNSKPRAWGMPKLAESICDLDDILHRADRVLDRIIIPPPLSYY